MKIKLICDFLAKACKECLLTPTACLCIVASMKKSHLHSPIDAVIQRTKLLYIASSMWTWQWPLKTFNWDAVGAEAIKLKLMKIILTEQNTVLYLCSSILYEWIRYCQSGRISLLQSGTVSSKKDCIVQNYGRVKSIIAAFLLLFIYKAKVLLGTNVLTSSLKRYWNVYWSGGTDIFPVCYSF